MDLIIRNERKSEYRAVEELTRESFWNLYVPGCSEHLVLHKMRTCSDFIPELDFVAELKGRLVGNIVYTRGKIIGSDNKAHDVICFGPLSVLPEYQKQGIGGSLIRFSLDRALSMGFTAVCIYGDPRYYHRFGFSCGEKYDIRNSSGKFAVALNVRELRQGILQGISGNFVESEVFQVDEDEIQKYETTFPSKERSVTESQKEFRVMASLVY